MGVLAGISARQITAYGIFVLSAYAAWARSGVYAPLQSPLLIASILLLFVPLLLERQRLRILWARMRRDPVFLLGLLFMVLLLFQIINSGYRVVIGASGNVEMAREPSKFLPWSVEPGEAGEMFVWFFPPWISVLFIRNLLHRTHVTTLLYLLAANSALLALAGLAVAVSGSDKLLGIWSMPHTVFFASFGYANHACAWFYMNALLAGGLAYRALMRKAPKIQLAVWAAVYLLCVFSVFMTRSRVGALVAVFLLGIFLYIFLRNCSACFRKSMNVYIFCVLVVSVGLALFLGVGGGALAREIKGTEVGTDLSARLEQMPAALGIVREYPVFGAGGWSYRWMFYFYTPEEQWREWSAVGMANVHCDPVQFLTEFGVFGASLLGAVCIVLGVRAVKDISDLELPAWLLAGLLLIFLHSLIDLPFRCPAILLEWAVLFAAVPRVSHAGRDSADPLAESIKSSPAGK